MRPNADPRKARRLRPLADRRDHRPLRAQGAEDRRAAAHDRRPRELAEQHYAEHAERPFFGELVDFITSAPIVAMVLEGEEAVKAARQVIGATNPLEAAPGSIRGDFAIETGAEHGPRLGLAGVGRARDRAVLRGSGVLAQRLATPPLPLVLASRSPQRRAILARLGLDFSVRVSDGAGAGQRRAARGRARERAAQGAGGAAPGAHARSMIGCDTVVALDGRIYGKPADESEAAATIRALGGRTPRGRSAGCRPARRRGAHGDRAHRRSRFRRARRGAASPGTWRRASGASAPAATRSRGPAPRWSRRSTANYENVVGLPLAALLDAAARSCAGSAGAPRARRARRADAGRRQTFGLRRNSLRSACRQRGGVR